MSESSTRRKFPGISPRAWEHPADRAALVALRRMRGFDGLLRKFVGAMGERRLRMLFLASSVRVGPQQLPNLHELLAEVCETLDLEKCPELYVKHDETPNAMAVGADDPFIVLNSSLVNQFDREELRCVLGHEVGHILSGHALYQTMLFILLRVMNTILPVQVVALPIVLALQEWSRKSELSADRAGLLVVQDLSVAQRVDLKLAGGASVEGLDIDAFAAQANEYEEGGGFADNLAKWMNLAFASHPFAVLRIAELRKWADAKDYEEILAGDYPERGSDEEARVDAELRDAAKHYRSRFGQAPDALSEFVRDALKTGQDAYSSIFGDDAQEDDEGSEVSRPEANRFDVLRRRWRRGVDEPEEGHEG